MDKFELAHHVKTGVECIGASWDTGKLRWDVKFRDLHTKIEYTRTATIFVSAVGAISYPRNVKFEGMDTFEGDMYHTARWNHSVKYAGKRMAVIGNGCSAAQVVPQLAKTAGFVKQYARSRQWYHDRPNQDYSALHKWAFQYVPLLMKLTRLSIFIDADSSTSTYMDTPAGILAREKTEAEAKQYIYGKTPRKYHDMIVPTFQLGCKRRIFDPEYLDSLHKTNVDLVAEGIKEITADGITSTTGQHDKFDIIILATGFQVSQFLTPMEIYGKHGISLNQQWQECRGAQAYLGTHVHNFPNLCIM